MAAVEALEAERPPPGRDAVLTDVDFPWRVLGLLNVFRLVVSIVLFGVFYFADAPRVIGANEPALAIGALAALLGGGVAMIVLLRYRFPGVVAQCFFQFAIDIVSLTLLTHASGGITSGVAGVLVISVGSLAMLLPRARAFLLAALTALVLLGEQTLAQWQGMTDTAQYASVGILGAVIFVITAVMQVLRTRMVETEALAEQRGVDLRNLAELNEYIIQHLRESIVVVDSDDRVRLINESALRHLGADSAEPGLSIEELSADLAEHLSAWRQGETDGRARRTIASADGATTIHPQFAPITGDRD